jgi:hypothetical protein
VLIRSQYTFKLTDRALCSALELTLTLAGVKLLDFPGANVNVIVDAEP